MLSTESVNESFFIDKTPYDECPICFEIVKETDRTVLKCSMYFIVRVLWRMFYNQIILVVCVEQRFQEKQFNYQI